MLHAGLRVGYRKSSGMTPSGLGAKTANTGREHSGTRRWKFFANPTKSLLCLRSSPRRCGSEAPAGGASGVLPSATRACTQRPGTMSMR